MISKQYTRSRKTIIKGLLTRAFAKSQNAGERMELLIDWRLAACNHDNRKAMRNFQTDYKLSDMKGHVSSGSRGIDAFNWVSVLEGRNDSLSDVMFEEKIKEMERMHYISRFFKNSEIKVDLEELLKASRNSNPAAPIHFDLPETQLNQRHPDELVYTKSYEQPSYMTKTLAEIDAQVDGNLPKSKNQRKRPDANDLAFLEIPKPKFGYN